MEILKCLVELADMLKNPNISLQMINKELLMNPILLFFENQYGKDDRNSQFFILLINKGYQQDDKMLVIETLNFISQFVKKEEYVKFQYKNLLASTNAERGYYQNTIHNLMTSNTNLKERRFEGRGVVYTAITGSYDEIKEPQHFIDGMDYYLFTNNPDIEKNSWNVCYLDNKECLDNVRLARKIKILGHERLKEYDYSIWIDGKLQIKGDLRKYIQENRGGNGILCFNHSMHNCVYKEQEVCEKLQKDDPEVMRRQIERYRSEGYPENNGMIDSACLVRDLHDEQLQETMRIWWNEVLHGSRRDQLSFNYACWKNKQNYDTSKLYMYGNEYFQLHAHNG